MITRRNLYKILQVRHDASLEVIKAAYRTLMKSLRHHPDLGGSHSNATLINEAYRVLSHPQKRAQYDTIQSHKHVEQKETRHKPENHRICRTCERTIPIEGGCHYCREHRPSGHPSRKLRVEKRRWTRSLRQGERIHFTVPHGKEELGTIIDLSPAGLRFRSPHKIAHDKVIRFRSPLIKAMARVKSCHKDREKGTYSIGVAFISVSFIQDRGTFIRVSA